MRLSVLSSRILPSKVPSGNIGDREESLHKNSDMWEMMEKEQNRPDA